MTGMMNSLDYLRKLRLDNSNALERKTVTYKEWND